VNRTGLGLTLAAILVAGAGGYWAGHRDLALPDLAWLSKLPFVEQALAAINKDPAQAGPVLYYQDPDGKPFYSLRPRQTADGRDFVAVHVDQQVSAAQQPVRNADPAAEKSSPDPKRVLYYRNPMGLPDTSPVPKKDSMGMDYIPVYQSDAADDGNSVRISLDKVQKLGVVTEAVMPHRMTQAIRAVGTVALDESRQVVVTSKFEGWVEKLKVAKTGDLVKRGDPLLEIFSPTLRIAESQYLSAVKNDPEMTKAATDRLRNQGMSDDQIAGLGGQAVAPRTMTIFAPADGQVAEKPVILGMKVDAGEPLYRLVDLSRIWVMADIRERDLASMKVGLPVNVSVEAYPGRTFPGTVSFISPMIVPETRTLKVRIELDNPGNLLKPGMFASVVVNAELLVANGLAIPESSLLDDGITQTVLVARGEGRFEPRQVKTGARADGYVSIANGLKAGEKVVVSANFLIDAESNLQSALRAFMADKSSANAGPGAAQ